MAVFFEKVTYNKHMQIKVHSYMKAIKKPEKEFMAGEPRYCQSCGKESHKLFQITKEVKKIDQLHYCEECKKKHDKQS